MTITVSSDEKRQIIDITGQVEDHINGDGLVNIFVKHTTAAITTADLDPGGTDIDYLEALAKMVPDAKWRHPHDPSHFPDHLWASIIGPNVTVPFKDSKLQLGTWQRIILLELDGPRPREVTLSIIKQ